MAHSDSDDEGEDIEFDAEEDAEPEIEDETLLDAVADDATEEGDEESVTDDTEEGTDEEEEEEEVSAEQQTMLELEVERVTAELAAAEAQRPPSSQTPPSIPSKASSPAPPPVRKRSLSPAHLRRKALYLPGERVPRSYTVEAICALPHPVPTHALASSLCMTHLLTGSDDGYIRNYDIFSAVNGKNFLTAPQRHHSGVVEGIMKAGQLRCWWENPGLAKVEGSAPAEEEVPPSPVYSLTMQSDALWALAGTDVGHINLFTVRHEPGRLCHVMNGHRGSVSALSLDHDEKSCFSAGWDGEALQWDLNTGQVVRRFMAHTAQMAGIAVRPANAIYEEDGSPIVVRHNSEPMNFSQASQQPQSGSTTMVGSVPSSLTDTSTATQTQEPMAVDQPPTNDADAKSDASFDPLFDDEPEGEQEAPQQPKGGQPNTNSASGLAIPGPQPPVSQPPARPAASVAPPKNAPPLLDSTRYATFSPDILMTTYIDGQIVLWDKRVNSPGTGVGRLWMNEKTPPWCLSACWSADGNQVYAGRRNGTVDVYDVRQFGCSSVTPRHLKSLRNPLSSGVVSCVVAFPDGRHLACASNDNLRLWNIADATEDGKARGGVQFKIIPGHHGGAISQMLVDPGARFLVSASSNRGWHGDSTRTVFVHDIKHIY